MGHWGKGCRLAQDTTSRPALGPFEVDVVLGRLRFCLRGGSLLGKTWTSQSQDHLFVGALSRFLDEAPWEPGSYRIGAGTGHIRATTNRPA